MMNELVLDDFFRQTLNVPTEDEQKLIGNLLKQMEQAIASNQRKQKKPQKFIYL